MEEKTADEIAAIFSAAGDSVSRINKDANFAAWQERHPHENRLTEDDWKEMIERNVVHLETIKDYKKLDNTTSIWTTESFTEIDAAITKGKTLYS
jgi:hypothetical protein